MFVHFSYLYFGLLKRLKHWTMQKRQCLVIKRQIYVLAVIWLVNQVFKRRFWSLAFSSTMLASSSSILWQTYFSAHYIVLFFSLSLSLTFAIFLFSFSIVSWISLFQFGISRLFSFFPYFVFLVLTLSLMSLSLPLSFFPSICFYTFFYP